MCSNAQECSERFVKCVSIISSDTISFCVFCVCGQRVSPAAASAGMRHAEGPDPGAVLLHDALR